MRSRLLIWLATITVAIGGVLATAAPADAVGAEVYRTDNLGNYESRVIGVGNTNPACCCVWHGEGEVGFGVKACYLPIP